MTTLFDTLFEALGNVVERLTETREVTEELRARRFDNAANFSLKLTPDFEPRPEPEKVAPFNDFGPEGPCSWRTCSVFAGALDRRPS